MRKIQSAGTGFIKLYGSLINLKDFKSIGPREMGYFEDPDEHGIFAIAFTPSSPSYEDIQNNVDGTWSVTYKESEKKDFEADCKIIENATTGKKSIMKRMIKDIIISLTVGLLLLAIEHGWFNRFF